MQNRLFAIGILLLLSAAAIPAGQSVSDLYQQGLARETSGDIRGAIQAFERIVADPSSNRTLTARALLQLGRWSALVGQDEQKYYERVVREFADQQDLAADARARLDGLAKDTASATSPSRRLVSDQANRSLGTFRGGRLMRDGRFVAFREDDRAFVQEQTSQTVRQLTSDGPAPAEAVVDGWSLELSTDGRKIAAAVGIPRIPPGPRPENERVELRVFDVGGRGPGRTLATWNGQDLGTFGVRAFGWSPRDDRIWLFVFRRDLSAQIVSVDLNGNLRILKTLMWRDHSQLPSLSRDGRFVTYHDGAGRQNLPDIYILATDGSREHRVEHPADDNKPMFLPDGSGVVFESNRRGARDLWFLPLADGRPGGDSRLVWRNLGPFGQANRFTDDGSLHYFFSGSDWSTYTVSIDLNAAGQSIGEPARLSPVNNERNSGAAFSPDGRFLAHFRANAARLVVRELTTGLEREIPFGTTLTDGYAHADWCPSGNELIAAGYVGGAGGSGEVGFRVNVSGASVQRVSLTAIETRCVGDGEIVYTPRGRGSIIRRSLASGRETTLFTGEARGLARSMDGTRLAFVTPHPNGRDYRLVTMPAAGGEVSADLMTAGTFQAGPQRVPLIFNPVWMPRGDRLIVTRLDDSVMTVNGEPQGQGVLWEEPLWEVPLTGAAPRRVGHLRLPGVAGRSRGISSLTVHPDGTQLAFQRDEGFVSQNWAIDNLFQFIKAGGAR